MLRISFFRGSATFRGRRPSPTCGAPRKEVRKIIFERQIFDNQKADRTPAAKASGEEGKAKPFGQDGTPIALAGTEGYYTGSERHLARNPVR